MKADMNYLTTDYLENYQSLGFLKSYFLMMYHSRMIFNMMDIAPYTKFEIVSIAMITIFSAIYNGQIFAEIFMMLDKLKRESNLYQERLQNVYSTSLNLNLTHKLTMEIMN